MFAIRIFILFSVGLILHSEVKCIPTLENWSWPELETCFKLYQEKN